MKNCIYSTYYKDDAEFLKEYLKEKWHIKITYDTVELLNLVKKESFDFILLDIESGGAFPTEVLENIRKELPQINIFILAHGNLALLKSSLSQYNISDFFEFPADVHSIHCKIESYLQQLNSNKGSTEEQYSIPIIGESDAIVALKKFIRNTAESDHPVLIDGETGVGKTMVARIIHDASKFSTGEFIPLNVSCIPEQIAESILFGAEKGAFTGAEQNQGLFLAANNGSLFLDEIENLSLSIQSKLLNVIESKKIRAIGSATTNQINFRLICATNKDLKEMVAQNAFREDLYYRLDVLRHTIPPLRARRCDIPLLAKYYLNTKGLKITAKAIDKLLSHNWPGNTRELFNCLERSQCNLENTDTIQDFDIEF